MTAAQEPRKLSGLPWRRLVRAGLLVVSVITALVCAGALIEHLIEASEVRRLTAGQTFIGDPGHRIRYRLTGEDEPGPAVVFVSGFGASLEPWQHLQDRVSSFAPVLSYDRGGTGLSDPSLAHDGNEQADELASLLSRLPALKPPYVIVGYSIGGMVVNCFAVRHPNLVAGLIWMDPDMGEQWVNLHGRKWRLAVGLFIRWPLSYLAQSAVGIRRMRTWVQSHLGTKRGPEDDIRLLTKHWAATLKEGLRYETTAKESVEYHSTSVPIGVLSTFKGNTDPFYRRMHELHHELAGSSPNTEFVEMEGSAHATLLADDRNLEPMRALVERVVTKAGRPNR